MNRPDPVLLVELTRSVQNALVADATARLQSGRARLGRGGQEALADKVLRQELQRIDTERLSAGTPRLTVDEERTLVERVLALSVGLGPVELLLADESVEEVVASRFDLVFVYRSDGSVEPLEERLWATEAEMESWLAHLARTAGRTERQFNGQVPLLVMRLGDGLRLAATRDVSQHVSFALRRNTLGKVTLGDLVGLGTLPEAVSGAAGGVHALQRDPPGVLRADRVGQVDPGAGLPGGAGCAGAGGDHRGHRRVGLLRPAHASERGVVGGPAGQQRG